VARMRALPQVARVAATVDLGRRLATESDPWGSLGRALLAQAATELGPGEALVAGRLLLEAREPERAKRVLLEPAAPSTAATLFALGDVEAALGDQPAARRRYVEALVRDPFDASFDQVADESVRGLPDLAELEAEVDGDPRAWCAPVGIVAGILPRPSASTSELPLPPHASAAQAAILGRARQFVDALRRAGLPDVHTSRDAVIEDRRRMKQASTPLFAWYMKRQVGAVPRP
jgi:hypothetical protein